MKQQKEVNATHLEEALQAQIARKNFVRAAILAQEFQHPQAEVRHLQELALKQMACEYRNAIATRNLAQKWGFSAADLENLLITAMDEHERSPDKIRLEQCYDAATGEWLTLRQWIERFLKHRGKT